MNNELSTKNLIRGGVKHDAPVGDKESRLYPLNIEIQCIKRYLKGVKKHKRG